MKKSASTRQDIVPLFLLVISLVLLLTGVLLKNLIVVAGVTGMVLAWFLCIDNLIANYNMSLIKRIIFGAIVISLPIAITVYMGT